MRITITNEEIETLRDLADDSGDMEWRRWADALADKIEAMQAENAALKQRIEESAATFYWVECDENAWEIRPNKKMRARAYVSKDDAGQWWCWTFTSGRSVRVKDIKEGFDEAERRLLVSGFLRHGDRVVRP